MTENQIKHQRLQNRLLEVLSEAIGGLSDERLSTLTVLDVKISKGKYDADVFLDGSEIKRNDRDKLLLLLKKANHYLVNFILSSEDWFKVPKLHFKFDDTINSSHRIDEIFKKISRS